MKSFGLDSKQSWKIAVFCGILYLFSSAASRVMGFMFVALISEFALSREEALWPLTVQSIFFQISAPLVNYLCGRWGYETVLRISSLLSSASICLCFLCPSVIGLSILFGVLHGMTLSGVFVAASFIEAEHFDKKRTLAQEVSVAISSLSMFFGPWAFRWALDEYGFRGALLVFGAASLNAFALSLAITRPDSGEDLVLTEEMAKQIIEKSCIATRRSFASSGPLRRRLSSLHSAVDDFSPPMTFGPGSSDLAANAPQIVVLDPEGRKSIVEIPDPPRREGVLAHIISDTKYFFDATFFIDVISFSLTYQGLATFMLLAVDFVESLDDVNFNKGHISTLTFSAFCIGDLLLRITAERLINADLVSADILMAAGFWIQTVALIAFAYVRAAWAILLACFVLGTSNGSRIFLFPIVFIADFGVGSVSDCVGVGNFFNALLSLLRPPVVGYFKDVCDDYESLFVFLAVFNIPFAVYWTFRWMKHR